MVPKIFQFYVEQLQKGEKITPKLLDHSELPNLYTFGIF